MKDSVLKKDPVLKPQALEDLRWWTEHNSKKAIKIYDLIKDIQRDPLRGIGKPEPLKHQFSGWHSRQIDKKNRLVYQLRGDKIIILSCKGHYD
ncbi:Txe/YoeB family addiction module toxin [Candidatus Poribacteria bacterium]|nr:Txe/YoeB family addiction module toxin [Candidatus Poribacteria bacterium]